MRNIPEDNAGSDPDTSSDFVGNDAGGHAAPASAAPDPGTQMNGSAGTDGPGDGSGGRPTIMFGYVPEIHGPGGESFSQFVPTRNELLELLRHYEREQHELAWWWFVQDSQSSSEIHMADHVLDRLDELRSLLGHEDATRVWEEMQQEFEEETDPEAWEAFRSRSPGERAEWCMAVELWPQVAQGKSEAVLELVEQRGTEANPIPSHEIESELGLSGLGVWEAAACLLNRGYVIKFAPVDACPEAHDLHYWSVAESEDVEMWRRDLLRAALSTKRRLGLLREAARGLKRPGEQARDPKVNQPERQQAPTAPAPPGVLTDRHDPGGADHR